MKNTWPKNIAICVFALGSLTAGAYMVLERKDLLTVKSPQKGAKMAVKGKRGTVAAPSFKNDNDLQACYEALLAREPDVQEGTVHLHMTIKESGEIDFLKMVHSDLDDSDFTDCVVEKVRQKRLPATADRLGVVISHKFNFHKRHHGQIEF